MDTNTFKLFFPHISERPNFVISEDKDLLFYNGIAVISDDLHELRFLKALLESEVFFKYLKLTTKDYASGYLSMSKNYIKNFGIVKLDELSKVELLNSSNPNKIIEELYDCHEALLYSR